MQLQLLGQPAPRTLGIVKDDGTTVHRKRYDGQPYQVPEWCGDSLNDHACAWGCMGIMHGHVAEQGRGYCKTCEMYMPQDGEVHVLKTPVLHNEEQFYGYVMGLPSHEGIGYPMRYPAIAVFTHHQIIDPQWGHKRFASQTEIVYPEDFKQVDPPPATDQTT